MKTLQIKSTLNWKILFHLKIIGLAITLFVAWMVLPNILRYAQPTVGLLDAGVWQLFMFALSCFTILCTFSWWTFNKLWPLVALPPLSLMVLQFYTLNTWQQLGFYWASFALFLLSAIACLAAVF